MVDADVLRYVLGSLPPAPARVLEVGAGTGELAAALRSARYEVVAIDPAASTESVIALPLHELNEPRASFDAAVAIVSMHHVEPLRRSCRVLAEVVRPGGTLVLDEIDVERFDDSAERWWLENRPLHEVHDDHEAPVPGAVVAFLRHHCHDLTTMEDALVEGFELGPLTRGPYLYRWELGPELRATEQELIATGGLPAVGVRVVGTRRPVQA
ncbi:MAG TPA: methyltransferase domain-containing protein [Solirubrobacteraceae bacterium]|nr:methyltransferase domain-containing protein [Solirubrobacteraceae bacterium]